MISLIFNIDCELVHSKIIVCTRMLSNDFAGSLPTTEGRSKGRSQVFELPCRAVIQGPVASTFETFA
jgi:hypothetical protein